MIVVWITNVGTHSKWSVRKCNSTIRSGCDVHRSFYVEENLNDDSCGFCRQKYLIELKISQYRPTRENQTPLTFRLEKFKNKMRLDFIKEIYLSICVCVDIIIYNMCSSDLFWPRQYLHAKIIFLTDWFIVFALIGPQIRLWLGSTNGQYPVFFELFTYIIYYFFCFYRRFWQNKTYIMAMMMSKLS